MSDTVLLAVACAVALAAVGVATLAGWQAWTRAEAPDWLSEGNVRP
jgi:hypothetical protein